MDKWIWRCSTIGFTAGLSATFLMLVSAICGLFWLAGMFLVIAGIGFIFCVGEMVLVAIEAWIDANP